MKGAVFATATGAVVIHTHVVYFLVPLPEPLGLPDAHLVECRASTTREQFLRASTTGRAVPPLSHLAGSVVFHRSVTPTGSGGEAEHLFELAARVFPGAGGYVPPDPEGDDGGGAADGGSSGSDRTFAEIAVLCDLDADNERQVSDAFDAGLGFLRELQRAYYLVRRGSIRLATREAMPFAVPFGVRRLFGEDGQVLPFKVPLSLYIVNLNLRRDVRDHDLTVEELAQFSTALQQQSYRGFVADYLEFVRETQVALILDGAYRSAVLSAATSCEVLLNSLLAHMLWEDGIRPEDAAATFAAGREGITGRVKRHYHPRLRGQWSVDQPGAVRDWFTHVAGLRNRVVHGDHEPTLAEARQASTTAGALATYLGDLLAAKTKTYPRTALVLPGKRGLERRGRWHKRLGDLQNAGGEVNWVAAFASWLAAMQRATPDSPVYVAPTSHGAWVYAVRHPDGSVRWVVRDPLAGHAALVDPAVIEGLTPADEASLNDLCRDLAEQSTAQVTSILFNNLTVPEPDPEEWRAQYRLLPLLGVMVDGNDLDD